MFDLYVYSLKMLHRAIEIFVNELAKYPSLLSINGKFGCQVDNRHFDTFCGFSQKLSSSQKKWVSVEVKIDRAEL